MPDAIGAYAKSDYVTAYPLFLKAARDGDAAARLYLGVMTMLGQAVPKNYAKGLALVRSAANAGVIDAQVLMGQIYENGYGVPADLVEALTWYKIAISDVSSGSQRLAFQAEVRANLLQITLPKEQVERATKRAREWEPLPLRDLADP
jgi:TPR repeat protein